MERIWKEKMGDVTSLTLAQTFDTIYLECCINYVNNKVVNGKKNLPARKLNILNEIYKRSGYVSCNPYVLIKQ